jgi:hypothetical protein
VQQTRACQVLTDSRTRPARNPTSVLQAPVQQIDVRYQPPVGPRIRPATNPTSTPQAPVNQTRAYQVSVNPGIRAAASAYPASVPRSINVQNDALRRPLNTGTPLVSLCQSAVSSSMVRILTEYRRELVEMTIDTKFATTAGACDDGVDEVPPFRLIACVRLFVIVTRRNQVFGVRKILWFGKSHQ